MKREEIPGYSKIRKELYDARVVERNAATVAEKEKAKKQVTKLRQAMAKVIYEYKEERKSGNGEHKGR